MSSTLTRTTGGGQRGTLADRRRRRRWRRRLVRGGLAALAVAVLAAVVWLLWFSTWTTVQEVTVEGAGSGLQDEVSELAAVSVGASLIDVDTSALAAEVAELPELTSASVERVWPQALLVTVVPREPVATIPDDDRWWRVDADGALFSAAGSRPSGLPRIDATTAAESAGERAAGVAVLQALPPGLAEEVERIRVRSASDIRLVLADDVEVAWGSAERSADKVEVLTAVREAQAQEDDEGAGVLGYDVSAPDRPAVRR